MYIYGNFINKKGDEVEVQILTKNDRSKVLEIGTEESGLFFTDDPVETSDEVNDVFDVLLTQSASIKLLVTDYVPDFFQLSALDAKVNIKCAGKLVFAGYIEPQTFSQDFNEVYDELELSCLDALSVLQYSQYKNVTNSANYAIAKAAADQVVFQDLILDILGGASGGLIIDGGESNVYYDNRLQTASLKDNVLANTSINELLFFDEDEDSVWTHEDVLKEVLRYYNLHIRQIGGDFYVYLWDTAKSNELAAAEWKVLGGSETATPATAKSITLSSKIVEDCGTQISVGDSYNQIKLTCDRAEIDELAISPLDDDSLVAPFPRRALCFREYNIVYDEGDPVLPSDGADDMFDMLDGGYHEDTDKFAIRDWYAQVYRNPNWKFSGIGHSFEGVDADVYDLYGDNELSLLDHVRMAPSSSADADIVPCIVKLCKSSEKHRKGDELDKFDENTTYMIVPVRGTRYLTNLTHENVEKEIAENITKRAKAIADKNGIITCLSTTGGGSLTPADEETTNYIVIEGSILLQQSIHNIFASRFLEDYKEYMPSSSMKNEFVEVKGITASACDLKSEDAKRALYYFPFTVPYGDKHAMRVTEWYNVDGTPASDKFYGESGHSFLPPMESGEALEFTFNEDHDQWDTVDKVAVLDCMLKVGDKYCVEIFDDYTDDTGHKRTRSTMKWLTEDECPIYEVEDFDGVKRTYTKRSFSIGINPEIGDHIIGEKHDIANTLKATDNIDAEGTALPIRMSDKLSGKVEFAILGPVNGTWNQVYRRHPTLFRHTKWRDNEFSILDYCSAIYIKDFKIGIYSDNGKVTTESDKDLIYMSDEDAAFRNIKECDDFRINSALTSAECISLGVANQVCMSNPTDESTGTPVVQIYNSLNNETAKPEQFYVDAYYNECHQPKIKMTQNLQDKGCELSMFDTYKHPALPGREFFIQGASRNLMDGSIQFTLREI